MIMNLKNAVSTMSHFVNDTSSVVNDAIDGLLLQSNGALARLDAFPRVVVRADWQRDRVALIAGGGSGHEPSHAGFVSDGLLTAAVCGDLFASPPVEAVLAAIRHVASREHGAVLIVKSYTGDRLNFALAMERARVLGFPVEMIVVEDDVALPDASRARGIAGTLFVHKICGYFAQRREPLARVVAEGRAVAGAVRSMGVALTSCALPGRASGDNRIAPGMMELGMGIHGEKGASTVPVENVRRDRRCDRHASARGPREESAFCMHTEQSRRYVSARDEHRCCRTGRDRRCRRTSTCWLGRRR
jgi:dihydroxyacetone kinase